LIAEYRIQGQNIHGEKLADAVSLLLRHAELSVSQIEGIAVSIGPGSFTGLRIGLGFAKGFAFGCDAPLAAVPTMDGLAVSVPTVFQNLCILLPSKKGEVYQGLYRQREGRWHPAGNCVALEENQLGAGWPDDETVFIGEGAVRYESLIRDRAKRAVFLPAAHSYLSGYGIASKGREMLLEGKQVEGDTLVPKYFKRFQGME
jgi:tRNA threonylcarbamoyladenosine biosynthesis protein TsaB